MRGVAAFAVVLLGACSGGQSPGAPSTGTSYTTFQSAHFTFRYTPIDAATIAQTAAAVEAEFARITEDIGVTQMPTISITLYTTTEALRDAVSPIVGPLPSFAKGLVTGPQDVHILSPNLRSVWAYPDGVTNIVHEFAHCVSLRLNPGLGNNPRWLWESVALFEASQYDDASARPYANGTPPPSLATLSGFDNTLVYGVGAWLGLFIKETRGWPTYRALISANGDLARVLGISEAAFLTEWTAFLRRTSQLEP